MTDGRLTFSQMIKDGAAGGISQCVEDLIKIMFNHMVEYIYIRGDVQPFGRIFMLLDYNDHHPHGSLGLLTPREYEDQSSLVKQQVIQQSPEFGNIITPLVQ